MSDEPYVTKRSLKGSAARWMERIKPYNTHRIALNKESSALLVIDMQNFFLSPRSPSYTCGGPAIVPNLRRLVRSFRHHNCPVIFTRHVHDKSGNDSGLIGIWWQAKCLDGTSASRIIDELKPLSGEKVVDKHRYSAFFDTDLETILRCLKVRDLVIAGVMTNMCCESTARDAFYRDYRVLFLADGTGSINEELQVASLMNLALGFADVTTTNEVIRQLDEAPRPSRF